MLPSFATVLTTLLFVVTAYGQAVSIPSEAKGLFQQLDRLERDKVKNAHFVELLFDHGTEQAWLIQENDVEVVVLRNDLLPWTFSKNKPTRIPSSWNPRNITLKEIKPADFEQFCRDLVSRKEKEEPRMRLHGPDVSYRVLMAHAAWKQGLSKYCIPILEGESDYRQDMAAFVKEALDDLAWLHYLRGMNLLMFADRREVLPHLRLAQRIAPDSVHAKAAAELLPQLERMVTEEDRAASSRSAPQDFAKLPEELRAKAYIAQLKDLHCVQFAQPGSIMPYVTPIGEELSEDTPSAQLKEMGYAAVPVLIKALEDDTPTRTVYHWRDFSHSRLVWRVSDFAWHILRDISGREFGNQAVVGFTYSSMNPDEQRAVREEVRQWYEETKNLSPDDRMMTYFLSDSFEDWVTAANHFLKQKDKRPVPLLLEKLKRVSAFQKGELCEVIAAFGDPSAVGAIREVLKNADEASDRIRAAIALWKLDDDSGVSVAIKYVMAEQQPYGSWDTPIWFLMRCGTDEALASLKKVVTTGKSERASEVIGFMTAAITGDLSGEKREPAGSIKLAEILIGAMDRTEETNMTINDVKFRIKDQAAVAFVVVRDGTDDPFGGRFVRVDPNVFNMVEPDASKRDTQIAVLKQWYAEHQSRLAWDEQKHRMKVLTGGSNP